MRSTFPRFVLGLAFGLQAAGLAAHAAGSVQVAYLQPEQFADAGNRPGELEDTLKQLTRHFEALAQRHLADGQKLSIEVLDIDLAGEVLPWRRGAQDVRVLKGQADWPRISLRYTLESTGQAPRRAEHRVTDLAYLQRSAGYAAKEPLGHEKRMLADWFSAEFGAASAK